LHGNEILTVDGANKLRRQKVENFLLQKEWVLLKTLKEDQLIIVSDVKLGLDGIKVNHILDKEIQEKMRLRTLEK
jgi:hypothetical protein